MPLDWLRSEVDELERDGLKRVSRVLETGPGPWAEVDGAQVLLFCSNDYLGLSQHPKVKAAAREAIESHGVGACSSRLVSGSSALHQKLEQKLAAWLGYEQVLLMPAGFMANLAVLSTLAGDEDLILSDELNHASIVQGCRLSRAKTLVYPHGDAKRALTLARTQARRRFFVTDSLFSVDGDRARLPELCAAARDSSGVLVVDEAHALGAMGPAGRGIAAADGVRPDILVGTLGKAFGVSGAFVAGSCPLIALLQSRAVPHIYTTAPPPALAAAAAASLEIISSAEGDRLRDRVRDLSASLRHGLERLGCSTMGGKAHVVLSLAPGAHQVMELSQSLFRRGVFVQGLRFPTVAPGKERLRWTVTAAHTPEHVERALRCYEDVLCAAQHQADNERIGTAP